MRILFVSRVQPGDERYGLAKSLRLVADALQKQGVASAQFGINGLPAKTRAHAERWASRLYRWPRRLLPNYEDHGLLGQILQCIQLGRHAVRTARRDDYSHLHLQDAAIGLGVLLANAWRRKKPTWGITQHSFDCTTEAIHQYVMPLPKRVKQFWLKVECQVLKRAAWVVFLSERSRQATAQQLGIAVPAHWRVIPHPLPHLQLPDRQAARAALGWQEHEKIILAIGQIIPMKGFNELLLASAYQNDKENIRVVVLGEGHKEALLYHAASLEVQCSATCVEDVGPYLAAADLYVSASQTESYGFANIEAVLAGMSAVCTAVGAVPEILQDSGVHLTGTDARSLAAGITQALQEDKAAMARLRAGWRKRQWSDEQIASTYIDMYRNMYRSG